MAVLRRLLRKAEDALASERSHAAARDRRLAELEDRLGERTLMAGGRTGRIGSKRPQNALIESRLAWLGRVRRGQCRRRAGARSGDAGKAMATRTFGSASGGGVVTLTFARSGSGSWRRDRAAVG